MLTPLAKLPLIGMPGLPEMIIIGLVVVVLFGATKLPKLGRGLGEGIRNFKEGIKGDEDKLASGEDKQDETKEDKG